MVTWTMRGDVPSGTQEYEHASGATVRRSKKGSWTLYTQSGVAYPLPTKATFDHAEQLLGGKV